MQIGIFIGGAGPAPSVQNIVEQARRAEAVGFSTFGMANIFSHDAMGALTLAGAETERIELMTAVVPTYPRHPHAMAQQALTVQAAAGGKRFVMGIGLSHKIVIENMFGYSFDRPARHMKEYLDVLLPLLNGEPVQTDGEHYRGQVSLDVQDAEKPVSCMLAAMGPAMLRLAGARTDGTILWMTAAGVVESYIAPTMNAAADEAGRPPPRIVVGLPVMLNSDVDGARATAAEQFANYERLPSYRSMLDKQGAAHPEDVAVLGTEEQIETQLRQLKDAGTTDFVGVVFGNEEERSRTEEFLGSLAPTL
ncbi:MAG: LLM class F420-dependent oxidoreductase [Chloroflexi bacterium]|nr:LLM class F420-dependent oxidoreductase [Chloroflexota bacterium]